MGRKPPPVPQISPIAVGWGSNCTNRAMASRDSVLRTAARGSRLEQRFLILQLDPSLRVSRPPVCWTALMPRAKQSDPENIWDLKSIINFLLSIDRGTEQCPVTCTASSTPNEIRRGACGLTGCSLDARFNAAHRPGFRRASSGEVHEHVTGLVRSASKLF